MEITWKTLIKIFSLLVVIFFLGIGSLFYWISSSYKRYESGFREIQTGDSKEKVIRLFGKPDEIESCQVNTNLGACDEIYKYSVPFESWRILILDDKVVDKRHSASG